MRWFLLIQSYLLLSNALALPFNYSAPWPPDGFTTNIIFDDETLLYGLGVYANAIEAVADWSKVAWDSPVTNTKGVAVPNFDIMVAYLNTAPIGSAHPLRMSHILLGLYRAVMSMTEDNFYRAVFVGLKLHGETKGVVRISQYVPQATTLGQSSNRSALALPSSNFNSISNANSGEIVDPKHQVFRIRWRVTGADIPEYEALSAVLDVALNTAVERWFLEQGHVVGFSSSGNSVMNFQASGWPHQPRLTSALMQEGLRMITEYIFLEGLRYAEMQFTMLLAGHEIAMGFLLGPGQTFKPLSKHSVSPPVPRIARSKHVTKSGGYS